TGKQPVSSIRMTTDSPFQTPAQNSPATLPAVQKEQPQASPPTNGDTPKNKGEVPNLRFEDLFPQGKAKWSKCQHGLKIATQSHIVDAKHHQIAVAVRNTLGE